MKGRDAAGACAATLLRLPALVGALAGAWSLAGGDLEARQVQWVQVEVGASREVLSGGQEDWEDYWIRATIRPGPRSQVYGGVRHARRFGHEDQQVEAGVGTVLGRRWTLGVDGTWSPTHRVLPRWGAGGSLHRSLPGGWGVFFGGGRQVYNVTGVNYQHVGVERYIAAFRLTYRLGLHQVDRDGSGVGHLVTGTWFYGDGSGVTLGLGAGREASVLGPDRIEATSVRSAAIWGTHWIDPQTGITYRFAVHRHGDFFTRTSLGIGVRRRL